MGYQIKAKLEINGKTFERWNSVSLKRTLNALSGIDISFPNPAGLYTNIPFEDMPIKFYLGYDTDSPPLVFDGTLDDISHSINKNGATIGIAGRDFGKQLFDQLTVDSSFKSFGNPLGSGYILSYIKFLNGQLANPLPELFEISAEDNNVEFQYMFEEDKMLEALKTLCSYGNYNWQMLLDQNNNRQFSVKAPKDLIPENVAHAFIVGAKENYTDIPPTAEVHLVNSLNVKKHYTYLKNYVKVVGNSAGYGNTGVEAVYPLSPPTNPKHLLHQDNGITNNTDAAVVAQRIWQSKSAPKILVDFGSVGVETLKVGDILYVNDYRYGASTLPSKIFRLIDISDTISFGSGWVSTYQVADYAPTLFGVLNGTDGL